MAKCNCFRCQFMANDTALKVSLTKALDVAIRSDEWDAVESITRDLLEPTLPSVQAWGPRGSHQHEG